MAYASGFDPMAYLRATSATERLVITKVIERGNQLKRKQKQAEFEALESIVRNGVARALGG